MPPGRRTGLPLVPTWLGNRGQPPAGPRPARPTHSPHWRIGGERDRLAVPTDDRGSGANPAPARGHSTG